jgi:hypothetical protein
MKKIYLFFFITVLLLAGQSQAQNIEWIRSDAVTYTMNPDMPIFSINSSSSSGNVYSARLDSVTFLFSGIYGRSIISCYDQSGTLQWSYSLAGKTQVNHLAVDASGNVYASGSFFETIDLNGTDSLVNPAPPLTANNFLVSLDNSGNLRWKRNVSLTHPDIFDISQLGIDHQNNCWYSAVEFDNGKIIRLDNSGSEILIRTISGTRTVSSFSFDPNDNLFIAGSTEGGFTLNVGGLTVPVTDSYNMFVARMTIAGTGSWIQLAHDVTFQSPSVIADSHGGAYVGGNLMDSAFFGSVFFQGPQWVYDIFLTKVDSLGNFSWGVEVPHTPTITGDFQRGDNSFIGCDADDNLYITGITRGMVDWGNGVTSGSGIGTYDITILSFDPSGTARWKVEGGSPNFNKAWGISALSSGICYFGGSVTGPATFDTMSVNSAGGFAFVLGKINPLSPTGIVTAENVSTFNIYPNPASSQLTVACGFSNGMYELNDVTGKNIKSGKIDSEKFDLDLTDLSSGIYFMTISSDDRLFHKKFVKQ